MKNLSKVTVFIFIFIFFAVTAEAKVLPQSKKTTKSSGGGKAVSSGVSVSPKLRADRRALVISFNNLSKASSVSYTLTYQTNGKDEGVSGSVNSASGNSTSRQLVFGTESSGVPRYHTNITNARLDVTVEMANGKRSVKKYRIKV